MPYYSRRKLNPFDRLVEAILDHPFIIVLGLVALMFFLFGGLSLAYQNSTEQTRPCTVVDKDRTTTDKGSTYRIYTKECDVLEITDNPFKGQYSSASLYAKIQPGHTYAFSTVGNRIPFLSQFPNIYEVRG